MFTHCLRKIGNQQAIIFSSLRHCIFKNEVIGCQGNCLLGIAVTAKWKKAGKQYSFRPFPKTYFCTNRRAQDFPHA